MRLVTIATLLASTSLALAQPAADPAIAEAEALAKRGDFVGAAAQFKIAHARDPRPELICNVGVAYYKAKQLPRAQLFLNRCLERGTALDAQFVDSVRTVLKSVEASLRTGDFTPVDIVVEPAGATVVIEAFGDDEAFIGSRVVWLERGKQTLRVRAEGYTEQTRELDVRGTEPTPVKIALERTPEKPVVPDVSNSTQVGSDPTTSSPAASTAQPEPLKYATPSKIPAVVATGVAIGAVGVALVGYQRAHAEARLAGFALSQAVHDEDASAVTKWNTVMLTGTVIGVASAGLAGYLWSRAFRSSVEVQASSSTIAISGRW